MRLFTDDESLITGDLIRLRYEGSLVPTVRGLVGGDVPARRASAGSTTWRSHPTSCARSATPTLLIHGRDDHVIPLASSLELLALLPHVDLHVLGSCGHWTMIERTPEFLAQVVAHLGVLNRVRRSSDLGRRPSAVVPWSHASRRRRSRRRAGADRLHPAGRRLDPAPPPPRPRHGRRNRCADRHALRRRSPRRRRPVRRAIPRLTRG